MTAFLVGLVVGVGMVAASWVVSAYVEHVATVRGAAEDEEELEAWRRLKAEEVAAQCRPDPDGVCSDPSCPGLQVPAGPADDQDDTDEEGRRV